MRLYSAKETYNYKEPTNRSHPIVSLCLSFAEYSLFCRALLQKRPIIIRSLLIVATPYCIAYRSSFAVPLQCIALSRQYEAVLQKYCGLLRIAISLLRKYFWRNRTWSKKKGFKRGMRCSLRKFRALLQKY